MGWTGPSVSSPLDVVENVTQSLPVDPSGKVAVPVRGEVRNSIAVNEPTWASIRSYSSTGCRVQKGLRIGWDAHHRLKANGFAEGRAIRDHGFEKQSPDGPSCAPTGEMRIIRRRWRVLDRQLANDLIISVIY